MKLSFLPVFGLLLCITPQKRCLRGIRARLSMRSPAPPCLSLPFSPVGFSTYGKMFGIRKACRGARLFQVPSYEFP